MNSTHFIPPASICKNVCNLLVDVVCVNEYQQLLDYVRGTSQQLVDLLNIHLPNCTNPSLPLRPLGQTCCSNAGAQVGEYSTTSVRTFYECKTCSYHSNILTIVYIVDQDSGNIHTSTYMQI